MSTKEVKTKQVSIRFTEDTLNRISEKCEELNDLLRKYGLNGNYTTASYIRTVLLNRLAKDEEEERRVSHNVTVDLDLNAMQTELLEDLMRFSHGMYEVERSRRFSEYDADKTFNYLNLATEIHQTLGDRGEL